MKGLTLAEDVDLARMAAQTVGFVGADIANLCNESALLEQFWAIKIAASDALVKLGGTITHHHAVGRDHRRWYDQERPELFASALRSVKSALDPRWLLNPGVLIDP